MSDVSPHTTLAAIRRLLLWLLLFGLLGTAIELVLMGHDEDAWQMIPLAVIALAAIACLAMVTSRSRLVVARLFRLAMVLLIVSGGLGTILHYRANMEFKLEMDPSMSGFALFSSVMRAKAPPALAPGNMALLGLLGLASAFRLDSSASRGSSSKKESFT
jgi:hypothetical protein